MVIEELLYMGAKKLSIVSDTPRLDAEVLLAHVLGKRRSYLVINYRMVVGEGECEKYLSLIGRRADGVPVAYLTNLKEFMSLEFYVDENVLIPRGDTETLCECVMERCGINEARVVDLCCGSGCIGISLAHYMKNSRVTLVDISEKAIAVAKKNAEKNRVSDRCGFVCADIMKDGISGKFDVVVSNPPYIETDVIRTLERGVAEYEPHIALDGGSDGLDFYRRLVRIVPDMLVCGGKAAFEVGHTQADAVMDMMKESFEKVGAVCDLAGIRRVVCGVKR